jgi:hypothetical protein
VEEELEQPVRTRANTSSPANKTFIFLLISLTPLFF